MKFEDLLKAIITNIDENGLNTVSVICPEALGVKLEDVKEAARMVEMILKAEANNEIDIKSRVFHLSGIEYGIVFVESGSAELIA